jgi:hypothetical protein
MAADATLDLDTDEVLKLTRRGRSLLVSRLLQPKVPPAYAGSL